MLKNGWADNGDPGQMPALFIVDQCFDLGVSGIVELGSNLFSDFYSLNVLYLLLLESFCIFKE
jgi:hypothetical protein